MKYRIIVCIAGMLCAAGIFAEQAWQFSYKGYPHKTTSCYEPGYFAGEEVTLSLGVPVKEGRNFVGWRYKAEEQLLAPGATFIMPAEDVELEAVFDGEEAIETVSSERLGHKELRDGQLIIIFNGAAYNAQGGRL